MDLAKKRQSLTHEQIAPWMENPMLAPPELRDFVLSMIGVRLRRDVVHPVPSNWGEVRSDIQDQYVIFAKLFQGASKVYITGSRTKGTWRDVDDPRCKCNGGLLAKRCPSDWDIEVEGLDLPIVNAIIEKWNSSHGPELFLDWPHYRSNMIEIPKDLWSNI